jgi:hypothetical protein
METLEESLLQPNAVMPVQFHAPRATGPERRLALAVLEDALAIHRKRPRGRRQRRLVTETEQWLFSDDRSWPFSCINLCDALGIDVAALRARLVGPGEPGRPHRSRRCLSRREGAARSRMRMAS